jgi:metal-responsive CopG/Arc/MetJ family transcriptional regulator
MENARKISVSLPTEWLRYTEIYRKTHGLSSRSEVIVRAMEALRERELAEGYRALAEEYAKHPDALLDAGVAEGLAPSSEETW